MPTGVFADFLLSYPHPEARQIRLSIAVGQLDDAFAGSMSAQNAICARYKAVIQLPRGQRIHWETLKDHIKSADGERVAEPPRRKHRKQFLGQRQITDWYPGVAEGTCGCRCYRCDVTEAHCRIRDNGCKLNRH